MKTHMEEVKKNVTRLIDYLPTALAEFSKIVENENLTPKQIGEKRHTLTATYPQAFRVLKFAFQQFMPKRGPHGGRRHGHRGSRRRDGPYDSIDFNNKENSRTNSFQGFRE
ncbi:hypothetical protein OSTOST_07604 [Ostertagia ostertagi]